MKKTHGEFSSFHSRTGSYSTHGRQNGRVDVLPPEAKEMLVSAHATYQQYKIMVENCAKMKAEHANCKPGKRKAQLWKEYCDYGAEVGKMKSLVRALRDDAMAIVFMRVAELRLDPELYGQIQGEAMSAFDLYRKSEGINFKLGRDNQRRRKNQGRGMGMKNASPTTTDRG